MYQYAYKHLFLDYCSLYFKFVFILHLDVGNVLPLF
jgi:hypothetical protein